MKLGLALGYWGREQPAGQQELVALAERLGYDSVWTAEAYGSDALTPLAWLGSRTTRLRLGTSVIQMPARTPTATAMAALTMDHLTGGRFVLGLGTQVRAHITRRFGMPWSHPVRRMREFVLALRAIWACWNDGAPLDVRGEFHEHRLMSPFFTPPPVEAPPKVWLAAVGPAMTRVTGEVADGLLCHAFTTLRYLESVTLPALEEGLVAAGRRRDAVEVSLPVMTVTGYDDEQRAAAERFVRQQIGFYGSTPTYRPVLEVHGWGDLADDLHRLSVTGGWSEMAARIPDEVVDAFAVRAAPQELGEALVDRCAGLVDRVSLVDRVHLEPADWARLRQVVADA